MFYSESGSMELVNTALDRCEKQFKEDFPFYESLDKVAFFGPDMVSYTVVVICVVNIVKYILGITIKSIKNAISDSKDRLTVFVALMGALISLIALFK